MPRLNLLPRVLLLSAIILLTLQSNAISYIKSAASPNQRSAFQIPSVSASSIVSAYVNQHGANNPFKVLLWLAWQTSPNGSPEQTASLSGSVNYTSAPVKVSGAYRLEIVPSTLGASPFPFSVRI